MLLLASVWPGSGGVVEAAPDPAVDFIVTPSRVEMRTRPGERMEVAITVYNRASHELVLDAYVEDIELPRTELVEPDDLAFTASRWLEFTSDQLVVQPGGDADIVIAADVPPGTPFGGYHAFGFLQSRPPAGTAEIQPSGRIGVTLLLEVAPDGAELKREARVSDGGIDVNWKGPFDAEVVARTVVDNVGDAHVMTGGLHIYRSWPGAGSAEVEIGPHTTLRGTRHTYESSWDAVPWFGRVTVTSEVVYQVGPDELPVIVTQHTVWIVPWHLIGVALVLIAVAAFLFRRRWANRSQPPEDTENHEEQVAALATSRPR